jgi:hypothetical protein
VGDGAVGQFPIGGGFEEGYIRPRIKLEFGARGEPEPCELRTITPYLAQEFPEELADAQSKCVNPSSRP